MWRDMRVFRVVAVAVMALAACGGGGESLPAGQYDLGHHVSAAVGEVIDVPDSGFDGRVVAVDIEWFNRGDQPAQLGMFYAVRLHDAEGREAELVSLPSDLASRGTTIPPGSSSRGWSGFRVQGEPAELLLYGGDVGTTPVVVKL